MCAMSDKLKIGIQARFASSCTSPPHSRPETVTKYGYMDAPWVRGLARLAGRLPYNPSNLCVDFANQTSLWRGNFEEMIGAPRATSNDC